MKIPKFMETDAFFFGIITLFIIAIIIELYGVLTNPYKEVWQCDYYELKSSDGLIGVSEIGINIGVHECNYHKDSLPSQFIDCHATENDTNVIYTFIKNDSTPIEYTASKETDCMRFVLRRVKQ